MVSDFLAVIIIYFSIAACVDFISGRNLLNVDYMLGVTYAGVATLICNYLDYHYGFALAAPILLIITSLWVFTYSMISYKRVSRDVA